MNTPASCQPDYITTLGDMASSTDTFDNWLSNTVCPSSVAAFLSMSLSRPVPRTESDRDELIAARDEVFASFMEWAETRTPGGPTSPVDRWIAEGGQ